MKILFSKRLMGILIVVLFSATPMLAVPRLSPVAEISLLTCSSGEELYRTFGHSAIRVFDPVLNMDRVYNYGTFDFNTDNFYLKFVRGKLNYWLSVGRFDHFIYEYSYLNQSVFENRFNFTQEEKQRMFEFLENNLLPQNRFYLYDFFFDNCATRIRDIVYALFPNQVTISDSSWHKDITFREGLDLYVTNQPLWHVGMDLGLGIPTDRKMDVNGIMFLPEYLMLGLESMVITTDSGEKPLLLPRQVLYEGTSFGSGASEFNLIFVVLMLIALAVIYVSYKEYRHGVHNYKMDNMVFIFPAVIAIVQLLLWFATDHRAAKINPDLLWSLPPLILIVMNKKKFIGKKLMVNGVFIAICMMVFYLFLWLVFSINYNLLILPLIFMVAARILKLYVLALDEQKPKHVKVKSSN